MGLKGDRRAALAMPIPCFAGTGAALAIPYTLRCGHRRPRCGGKDPLQSPVRFAAGSSFPPGEAQGRDPHQSPIRFTVGASLAYGTQAAPQGKPKE